MIIALYRARKSDGTYPELVINSIDLKKGMDFMASQRSKMIFGESRGNLFRQKLRAHDMRVKKSNLPTACLLLQADLLQHCDETRV